MAEPTAVNVTRAPAAAPQRWEVPGAVDVQVLAAFASFDGTGAAGSWQPSMAFYSDAGILINRVFPQGVTLGAGDSADVSYGPFLDKGTNASSIINALTLDDYVYKNANTTVTALGHGTATNVIIQGNPITLDGNTRVKIEFFAPCVQSSTSPNNQAVGFELWDGTTDIGTIAYVTGNVNGSASELLNCVKAEAILTPSAGTHTYKICAYKNLAGGTCTVFANTFADGTGNFGPAWYRVTAT